MLQSLLRIQNFGWWHDVLQSCLDGGGETGPAGWQGQFAFADPAPDGRVTLTRDRLGINKLFFAVHEMGRVVAANYLVDLVRAGVPVEACYSVPAGHAVTVDARAQIVSTTCHAAIESGPDTGGAGPEEVAREIRTRLELWFARLAQHFGRRKIYVCLSGGLDSGVIAALARAYFRDVTAYTYGFDAPGVPASEDVVAAERLAAALRIPFRFVPASAEDVRAAVDDALCYGQDWRDFNVHCAIVNEILARAMRRDAGQGGTDATPLILTGDLANEFLADYTPVSYRGREYYRLPRLSPGDLRLILIRGLDAGDREVGVFNHHGLDVIQPYGFALDQYLRLPASLIGQAQAKQRLDRAIAGDLLPGFVFDRVKVRAQIGSASAFPGILTVLLDSGCDAAWLRRTFGQLLAVKDQTLLSRFIRAGRYRAMSQFPEGGSWIDGYLAA